MKNKNTDVKCPVCASLDHAFFAEGWDSEYLSSRKRFPYHHCHSCDCVFILEPPLGELGVIYPKNYYSFSDSGKKSILQTIKNTLDNVRIKKILAQTQSQSIRVLDVGGGDGWLLSVIKERNPAVTDTHEVDLDALALEQARKKGHTAHHCRIEDFRSDLKFDFIVLLNIIEHVADPVAVLRQCHSLLSPHGRILIKTPNHKTLSRWLFKNHNWGGFHCPRHWVLFTMAGLENAAARVGLKVEEGEHTQGGPQWATSILGWLADKGVIKSITSERPMYKHPLHNPLLALFAAFDMVIAKFSPTAQFFLVLRKQ